MRMLTQCMPTQAHDHGSSRHALLTDSFNRCLEYGLAQPTFEEMQGYFPGCPEAVIHALQALYQQVLAHVQVHSQEEFKDICSEHGLQARLSEAEQLSALAQAGEGAQAQGTPGFAAAIQASEKHARVVAKQQEVAHLQHLLDQATSTRNHLQEVAAQKQKEVARVVEAYAHIGADVKMVFDASCDWKA